MLEPTTLLRALPETEIRWYTFTLTYTTTSNTADVVFPVDWGTPDFLWGDIVTPGAQSHLEILVRSTYTASTKTLTVLRQRGSNGALTSAQAFKVLVGWFKNTTQVNETA